MPTPHIHRFSIGAFTCWSIADGRHDYPNPAALLFPEAPTEKLRRELLGHDITLERWTSWTSDYTCLLVDTGTHRVLMDTGAGKFLPEAGNLTAHMRTLGIEPQDIDMVLFSHAHPDHVGCTDFPNARMVMHREEWTFWRNEPALPRLPGAMADILVKLIPQALSSLEKRIELVDEKTEIVPGITMIPAPGHTPGHMAVSIHSEGRELVYAGDAILHPVHMQHPDWSALVDVLPDTAAETRTRLMAYAMQRQAPLFGFHLPFPALRQVARRECAAARSIRDTAKQG